MLFCGFGRRPQREHNTTMLAVVVLPGWEGVLAYIAFLIAVFALSLLVVLWLSRR